MSQAQSALSSCPECNGTDGHHYTICPSLKRTGTLSDERNPAEGNDEIPPATFDEGMDVQEGGFDEQKMPPTADELMSVDMLWLIAKLCHEVNAVFCRSLGDHTILPWDEAPSHQRQSTYKGVTFAMENPDAGPEDSHASWLREKEETGWSYGPVKDEQRKEHPCFVPYNQLPPAQQFKDEFFISICRTMLG